MQSRSRLAVVLAAIAATAMLVALVIGLNPRHSGPELAAPGADHATISAAASANGPVAMGNGVLMGADQRHDTSAPLRQLKQYPVRALPLRDGEGDEAGDASRPHPNAVDTVVQSSPASPAMPATGLNFDGIPFPGVSCNCAPPDTNGEVGATQYVQIVNEGYQVFSKSTGASVFGPVGITTIWSGFGGVCETAGDGDPVVLYDQFAQRWVVSQFAGSSVPTDECIAVSTTSDATSAYHRYDFHLGSNFMDYPHGAVWSDGYYFSFNVFNSSGTSFLGAEPFVFDRTKMLAGQPATFQTINPLGSASDAMLPADIDGSTLPPSGAAESFVAFPSGFKYTTFHYHVDWTTPANTAWTTFAAPTAAGFTQLCPTTRACVPEPNGSTLDALADRPMFRLAYRNFGDHEAIVGNFTVSSGGVAGIRWFELRGVTSGPETVFQESTYQPDSTWRWMGSAAMDKQGNLAIGFNVSSSSVVPGLRYAGRLVGDPLGTLGQGEAVLFAGVGSQSGTSNRWGDYADLTIDPVDDCTFWFTSEYYPSGSSSFNWRTRIGTFTFPGCATPQTLTSIGVTPSSASVPATKTQQFSATAYDQNNQPMSPQPTFTWTATGGTVSSTGLFTAGSTAGTGYSVTATSGSVHGSASVTVTAAPALNSITVSPTTASVQTGKTQQFSATAYDQYGQAMSPQPSFAWTATGGTISSSGLFTAGSTPGTGFSVTATSGSVFGTASVTVTAPPPDFSFSVSPSSFTVKRGGTATYTITINRLNGFTGAITFSLSGAPSKSTITFNPNNTSGNSVTLTVKTSASAAAKTYTLTITGVSGSLSHAQTVGLTVTR